LTAARVFSPTQKQKKTNKQSHETTARTRADTAGHFLRKSGPKNVKNLSKKVEPFRNSETLRGVGWVVLAFIARLSGVYSMLIFTFFLFFFSVFFWFFFSACA
jgi:hypothetical protein